MAEPARAAAILVAIAGPDEAAFRRMDPELFGGRAVLRTGRDRRYHGDGADLADVRYLLAWAPRPELFVDLPNLEIIFSLGAGVDHLLDIPGLPDVPIVRFVDPDMTGQMSEYVVWQVLHHHRQAEHYRRQQSDRKWEMRGQAAAREVTVGILGAGVLGRDSAGHLLRLGFNVRLWSRSGAPVDGVHVHAGPDELGAFLSETDIAVCMLPLTAETRNLLDASLIRQLRADGPLGAPVLINAGRGGCQVDADIAAALQSGALAGASLDVFENEPLPPDSPLWDCPNLVITPHCAAVSDPHALATGVLRQIEAYERGEPLVNVVDRGRGY